MSRDTHEQRLAKTIEIAEQAGKMILRARQEQRFGQRLKAGEELVTDIDVAVDRFISEALETAFPGEARLSEELAPEQQEVGSGPLWVVDPIDGTVNFAHGLRHVAVSIGWMEEGVTQVGVVHAPFLDETFTALKGQGAWRNGVAIAPSHTSVLEHALVATGFPYQREQRKHLLPRLTKVLANCRDVRRNGAAALDICDIACGRLDAYYESVSPWDFVAGWLIAKEAGARAGHLIEVPEGTPEDIFSRELLVTAPGVFEAMRTLLQDEA
ncbi:inositol monophosphatase family protein [Halomonas dongshanensis]|uniref:Inositol-1-monophosphatase n=1 Tax=Halomonas dongshanensis TaxID=2890835 RepID=A0ABT2ECR4_9GAMM|nr:inositol monophosphatase family protein [Halomonas dongshanensis]MCS2609370.1 inositol monophosphatase [Halomonas dongshanensis]